eukprot:m.109310 g.109310  ORF g.109310 m.109310 type:complete len:922 (+) comp15242_c0_seq4:120-2885(+)
MSRFWAADSSDESSTEEEDNVEVVRQPKNFVRADFSDDEEDETRVVKSKEQKFRDEINGMATQIRNKLNVGDWVSVEDSFNNMFKALDKNSKIVEDHGVPIGFLKIMVELDDAIQEAWSDRKKLNKLKAQSLNKLKPKMRKQLRDTKFGGKSLQEKVDDYRENPVEEEDEVSDEERSGDEATSEEETEDEEEEKAPQAKPQKTAKMAKGLDDETSGEESDESFWDTDEEDEEEEEEQEELGAGDEQRGFRGWVAADFLKSTTQAKKRPPKEEGPKETQEQKPAKTEGGAAADEKEFTLVVHGKQKKERILFEKGEDVTFRKVQRKLRELLSELGKRTVSLGEIRGALLSLRQISDENDVGTGMSAEILIAVITTYFAEHTTATGFLRLTRWAAAHNALHELLCILLDNPHILVMTVTEETAQPQSDNETEYRINSDLVRLVERLDEEFTRSLRNIDPHSPDYIARLSDELVLYNIICMTEQYYVAHEDTLSQDDLARVRLLRVEHIYYKRNAVPSTPRGPTRFLPSDEEQRDPELPPRKLRDPVPSRWVIDDAEESKPTELVDRLCKFIYHAQDVRIRGRAVLCHIYHYALIDKWEAARDLMLMSHLQEHIKHADIPTQILYNRTMAQLGLCAFRAGNIYQAQSALNEIVQGGKSKELLAQGYKFRTDKTQEQITEEKMRQTPFHLHINLGLIESVYYISSMLLEIPLIARHGPVQYRNANKNFRHRLEEFCREAFQGPAETTREKIMSASLAMLKSDWKRCLNIVQELPVWSLTKDPEAIKTLLTDHVKKQSLRTFLFANAGYFDSISLKSLEDRFELDSNTVRSTISELIYRRELPGYYDPITGSIIMYRQQPSSLQSAATLLSDKVGQFMESNDRLFEKRQLTFSSSAQPGDRRRPRPQYRQQFGHRQMRGRVGAARR